MSKEYVEKLLAGSRKIDQMRMDLDQTVRIVLGLVQMDRQWQDRLRIQSNGMFSSGEDGFWEVAYRKKQLHARFARAIPVLNRIVIHYSSDEAWKTNDYSENVAYVWNRLPKFVEDLKVAFPKLESAASRLIEAAS